MSAHDVVVIGAGIAGLSASAAMAAAGLDVICLEATDRVGGRLMSLDVDDGSLDLGATWFWPGEPRIASLVHRLGLTAFPQYTAGAALFDDGRTVAQLRGNPIDVAAWRHTAGAQSLADALAAGLPPGTLRLAVPVGAIEADADRLQVTAGGTVLGAAHVVLAVPPALAVSRISFEPALPVQLARLAASCPVWMGAVSKIVVQYPEAFWRAAGLAGAAQSMLGPLREIHDMSGPDGKPAALFGFAATAGADPRVSEERATEEVVGQLVRLFGPKAAAPDRVVLRDWGLAPYTSPPEVERRTDYALFGHRLLVEPAFEGRLHWASAETSERNPGHVEGALAAAERAAARVIAALTPS